MRVSAHAYECVYVCERIIYTIYMYKGISVSKEMTDRLGLKTNKMRVTEK